MKRELPTYYVYYGISVLRHSEGVHTCTSVGACLLHCRTIQYSLIQCNFAGLKKEETLLSVGVSWLADALNPVNHKGLYQG